MKKVLLLALFYFSLTPLSGAINPDPCNISIQGEWLYLNSSLQDTFFATNSVSADFPNGERKSVGTDFHSGFRLEGAFGLPSELDELRVRWTHYSATNQSETSGPNIFTTLVFSDLIGALINGVASSQVSDMLNSVEALYLYHFLFPCQFQLALSAGAQYVYLRANQLIEYNSDTADIDVERRSRMWGIGPQVGIDMAYQFSKDPVFV